MDGASPGEGLKLSSDVVRRTTVQEVRISEFLDPRVHERAAEEGAQQAHGRSLETPGFDEGGERDRAGRRRLVHRTSIRTRREYPIMTTLRSCGGSTAGHWKELLTTYAVRLRLACRVRRKGEAYEETIRSATRGRPGCSDCGAAARARHR